MTSLLAELWRDNQAVTTVEYAMLMVLVVLAGISAWQTLAQTIGNALVDCTDQIANGGT